MRSFQVTAFGEPLAEAVAETPLPQGSEVLVKVDACGVCHSDIHLWEGYFDLGGGKRIDAGRFTPLPLTPGHEILGEVMALGPEAEGKGVRTGERRLVYPWIGCGDCAYCDSGRDHLCDRPRAIGINVDGGYADHVKVPHPRFLVDVGELTAAAVATLACSGLTAYSALKKVAGLGAEDPLLIMGAGGVGLAAVRMAQAVLGVAPIVADIDPVKREAALRAGAAETIDPAEEGAGRALMKRTRGIAAALDFVGAEASASFALNTLRANGRLIVVGLHGGSLSIGLPYLVFRRLEIGASYVGSPRELEELVALVREGAVPLIPVEERPLEKAQATLDDLKAGRVVGRVVLTP